MRKSLTELGFDLGKKSDTTIMPVMCREPAQGASSCTCR